ncbi:MAG: ABC transporter permease [Candidatus Woesearchaeota archaeon]
MILKNFRLLIRSKASALIIIIGPLLVILLLGLAFDNTNAYALNIGVYSTSYTEVINSFLDKLSEKHFNVVKVNLEEDCTQRIKEGALHACIVFPEGFSMTGADRKNEITFYVDYSRVNIVYLILDSLTSKISMRSKEISMELTNTLLTSLENTRVEVFSTKPLLSKLASGTGTNQASIVKIVRDWDNLDLAFSVGDLGLDNIADAIGNTSRVAAKIDSARSKISTARSMAESIEGASDVVSDLNSAYSYLTDAKNIIGTNSSAEVSSLIDIANQQATAAKTKLENVAVIRMTSEKTLNGIKSSLNESVSSIQEIQASFDKIDNYIGSVQIKGADEVVSPIKTSIKALAADTTHLNQLFPSLIVLVVMFVSILLSTTLVMMEKHSPAYFRNFITPVSDFLFVISTYFTNMVLVLLQIVIIIAMSVIFFSSDMLTSALEASVALILITSAFTFIGMFIGYIFTSEETGTLASISVGSLFLLLSNLIIPLESVPESLRNILAFNPFVVGELMLRKVLIYHQTLDTLQQYIIYFLVVTIIFFTLVMLINLIARKNLLRGFGSVTPSATKMSLIPSFLRYHKKPQAEATAEATEKKKKQIELSARLESAKKAVKNGVPFFKYLK